MRNRYLRCTSAPGKGVLVGDGQTSAAEAMSPGTSHVESKAAYDAVMAAHFGAIASSRQAAPPWHLHPRVADVRAYSSGPPSRAHPSGISLCIPT